MRRTGVCLLVFGLICLCGPAVAAPVNFNATGVAGVTGYVQFEDSLFDGGVFQTISNSTITDLAMTVFGSSFVLSDVSTGANTFINSSGPEPLIVNGGGLLADNGVFAIAFYPDGFNSTPVDGDASLYVRDPTGGVTYYAVLWSPTPIPEPTTLALFGLGLVGVVTWRRRSRKAA